MTKKSFFLRNAVKTVAILAVMALSSSAMAQTPTDSTEVKKEKKKGGFLKFVESTTGLDVSKEVVFVYPKIGEWKFELVSCIGNKTTREVVLKLKVLKILDGDLRSDVAYYDYQVSEAGTKNVFKAKGGYGSNELYDFKIGVSQEVAFQAITGVPEKVKMLDVKFCMKGCSTGYVFEGRSIPIQWVE